MILNRKSLKIIKKVSFHDYLPLICLAIIFAIQANAIWGKMLPAITSVRSVIVSSFVLCIALSSVAYYL